MNIKIEENGVIVIPAKLRERCGLLEGSLIIAEEISEGILLRPEAVNLIDKEAYADVSALAFLKMVGESLS